MSTSESNLSTTSANRSEALFRKLQGAVLTQALVAAAQLEIAELLADGPLGINELATKTGADSKSLHRLLRLLSVEGFVSESTAGAFELLPLGRLLRRNEPGSVRAFVLLWGEIWFWNALAAISQCIRTGTSGVEVSHGQKLFEFLDSHERARHSYCDAMESLNEPEFLQTLVDAYPFRRARLIVDLGGGTGSTMAAILRSAPETRGVLFDRPTLRDAALRTLEREGVLSRCQFEGGNFLESVPRGADLYLMKWIIVDWSDLDVLRILGCTRAAMGETARILVIAGLQQREESLLACQTDLITLAIPGGARRTESEIVQLFSEAGLIHVPSIPVNRHWILEFGCDDSWQRETGDSASSSSDSS